jgi:hypothetical protein
MGFRLLSTLTSGRSMAHPDGRANPLKAWGKGTSLLERRQLATLYAAAGLLGLATLASGCLFVSSRSAQNENANLQNESRRSCRYLRDLPPETLWGDRTSWHWSTC